jgi:hypothetical protein
MGTSYFIFILPIKRRPAFHTTKIQRGVTRTRQTIGTIIARRTVMMDPPSSREETNTLPVPAVTAEDFARKMMVMP